MRITSVNLPEDLSSTHGLKKIVFNKLSDTVIIVGPNGSGKSRLLKLIKDSTRFVISDKVNDDTVKQLNSLQSRLIIEKDNLQNMKSTIERHKKTLLQKDYITVDDNNKGITVIDFVPKETKLFNSFDLPKSQIFQRAKQIENLGIEGIDQNTFAKIQAIQTMYIEATHPDLKQSINEEEKQKIISAYDDLKKYIKIFLNTDLERHPQGEPMLFGFKAGESMLSNGQTILLQYCMAIYSQRHSLENAIIFLDEPENHLHPSAIQKVIENIKSLNNNQPIQIWIATHSIPLISQFPITDLYFMEQGTLNSAARKPELAIKSLIGEDDNFLKLQNLMMPSNSFASINYSLECLFAPEVSDVIHDDQSKQILEAIKEKQNKLGRPINILDFGAGKGRLLDALRELLNNNNSTLASFINYYAYDISEINKTACTKLLESCYADYSNRFLTNLDGIKDKTFDIIIMCNVLHEIHPIEWNDIFNNENSLFKSLELDGILLIVEDQHLPVGEFAHDDGFLVLNPSAVNLLFSSEIKTYDYRKDGRLIAYAINKQNWENFNQCNIGKSIEEVFLKTKEIIQKLRMNKLKSYKDGLYYAFLTQQMLNSYFIIEKLKSSKQRFFSN